MSGATAYRAHALQAVGGFDETFSLPANEDFEIGIRLKRIGTFGYVPGAVAFHARRKITLKTLWKWRRFWRFTFIVAKRYGVFGVPQRGKITRYPRLRTASAAVVSIPVGRCLEASRHIARRPFRGVLLISFAVFEFICNLCALPEILFSRCPERHPYLKNRMDRE